MTKRIAILLSLAACSKSAPPAQTPVEHGAYLVLAGGCNDCHTPLKMGAHGPERDASRLLSGHPAGMPLPPPPAAQGPWMFTAAATMTAWSGPWGVSFTANLTPDKATGLGAWSADQFITSMRAGKHLRTGRPLLPPMPAEAVGKLTDNDLRDIYAYLQSIPAVSNQVPDPIPPATAMNAAPAPQMAAAEGAH